MNDNDITAQIPMQRQNRLTFYHPSQKGGGAALRFDLRLNRSGEDRYNCFFEEMANQNGVGGQEGGQRKPASFDWQGKVTVKLDFLDVSEFLAVIEGRRPQAGDGQNGMYHSSADASTLISFRRHAEREGYALSLSKKKKDGTQLFKGHILLSEAEATGLRCVFQTALFLFAFGADSLKGVSRPAPVTVEG
jgi:hypothetical protein